MHMIIKNVKHVKLNGKTDCYLEYTNVKDDLILYKCFCCNCYYQKMFDENSK